MVSKEKWIAGVVLVVLLSVFVYYTTPDANVRRSLRVPRLAGGGERETRLLGEMDLERLYPGIVLRSARDAGKMVALTFDDGPDGVYTPQVLDILRDKGIPGAFFVVGNRVHEFPEVAQRIVDEGHVIGNHTYSHALLTKASGKKLVQELEATEKALGSLGLSSSRYFRPPYGAASPSLVEESANLGYRFALWSVDSLDWRGLSKAEVENNVLTQVQPGSVILLHSGGGPGENLSGSVSALPSLIDTLLADGYRFVTLDEMFPARLDP